MSISNRTKLNLIIIIVLSAALFFIACSASFAASAPRARGSVNASNGAVLRKSSSNSSKKVAQLSDNTELKIYREVFKSKKSISPKKIWYYVKAGGKKGYIRSDMVDNVSYGTIAGNVKTKTNVRVGAGTKMTKMGSSPKGTVLTVILEANPVSSAQGSSKTWYKATDGKHFFYICSKQVKLTGSAIPAGAPGSFSDTNYANKAFSEMTDTQFDAYLTDQGFPESYKVHLRALHKAHPNWGFVAYDTGIGWSNAVAEESKNGRSLISASQPSSYRSSSKQAEKGWYPAKSTVVAYYLDPRNFLNENTIYMFEDLSYKPAYQTAGAVADVLKNCRLPQCGFTADLFVKAGAENNVSPVFLAARARQENGSGGLAVNGQSILGAVYNPFNIGANGGTDPLYNGLVYARAAGWTTPEKALTGGAALLAKYYINQGQNTLYYQKFNARNGAAKMGTHQYMTNIQAAYNEALSVKKSYTDYGITVQSLVFEIPVYAAMPASTSLP